MITRAVITLITNHRMPTGQYLIIMPNWCSTSYAICSGDKQLLQRICDAINECSSMVTPLISKSCPNWTGNIFKKLELKGGQERTFWSDAKMEDGVLKFIENSAWSRGMAILSLQECYISEDDIDFDVYFMSEEPGNGIWETNDEEGLFFPERYLLSGDDGCEYYNTFDELVKEIQELLVVDTKFKNVAEINVALDEAGDKIGCQQVHEIEIVNLE